VALRCPAAEAGNRLVRTCEHIFQTHFATNGLVENGSHERSAEMPSEQLKNAIIES